MRSEERKSREKCILMKCHYPDLGSASDWSCEGNFLQEIRSTPQICIVTRHQYGISALVSLTSFCGVGVEKMSAAVSGHYNVCRWSILSNWQSIFFSFVGNKKYFFSFCDRNSSVFEWKIDFFQLSVVIFINVFFSLPGMTVPSKPDVNHNYSTIWKVINLLI